MPVPKEPGTLGMPWEKSYGYAQAVRVGDTIWVSGQLSHDNEGNMVGPAPVDAQGRTVTIVQVAGQIARRILCYVKQGDQLARGQRYGFIRFGSRVDVYLPPDALPRVAPGDKVSASSTILASFAR